MAKAAVQQPPQSPPKDFEDALGELETILSDMESGETGLEQSLVKFERGNFLIRYCRGVLESAEKQIELLTLDAGGQLRRGSLPEAGGGPAAASTSTDDSSDS